MKGCVFKIKCEIGNCKISLTNLPSESTTGSRRYFVSSKILVENRIRSFKLEKNVIITVNLDRDEKRNDGTENKGKTIT